MKTNIQFWSNLAQFFLEQEMFQKGSSPIFPAEKIFSDITVVVITITTTTTNTITFACF